MKADHTFEIEIQIIDHCNMNCDHCNHFANLAQPWTMPLEEFEFSLRKIREEFYPHGLKRLMILGGEPLLHPQIKDFCVLAREIFPEEDFQIDVLTNGLKLGSIDDKELKTMTKNVRLCITPYPKVKYTECAEKMLKSGEIGNLASRLFFMTTHLNLKKTETSKSYNYKNCAKYKLPCYFVKNYKVYICPFSGCSHILDEKFGINIQPREGDYLDLKTCTYEDLVRFSKEGPKHICQHCDTMCMPVYWSNGGKMELEDYLGIVPKELFMHDYQKYDKLFNGKHILDTFRNEEYLVNKVKLIDLIDWNYCGNKTKMEVTRFKGKIDIIIPFYNITKGICIELLDTLKSQTIIKDCHIYLVSDNSPYEEMVFGIFEPHQEDLNITFLKTPQRMGPGGARQVGIDRSYNRYLFFLDSDDLLINEKGLEEMFSIIESNKGDIASGVTRRVDWVNNDYGNAEEFVWLPGQTTTQDSHCLLYSREFLDKNEIRFKGTFIAEDADFLHQVMKYQPVVLPYKKATYLYKRNLPTSIGAETSLMDKLLSRIIINLGNEKYKSLHERWYDILYADDLICRFDTMRQEEIETVIGVTFYFGLMFYEKLSYQEKRELYVPDKQDFTYILHDKITTNDLGFRICGEVYKNKTQYRNLVMQVIEKSSLKESLLKELESWI